MCGIAGFIDFNLVSHQSELEKMVRSIRHRGPDDFGVEVFTLEHATIGFGQARLSIIDLSSAGHQPMHYKNLSIVFNGEIYNYKEIRAELQEINHVFVTSSDTEVILHAFEQWGDEAVNRFIGMFTICLYDRTTLTFSIHRDRAGIKPLYYYFKDGLFLFGSELKALMAHTHFEKTIDVKVMPTYLHYGYIPAPTTIFENCYKLLPGHKLLLDLKTKQNSISKYWDVTTFYKKEKKVIDYPTAKEELHELLKSACSYRMVADVPVGVFLSGGYDSTAVTAILQSQQVEKLKTFTIGFEEGNNEAPYAKNTAAYLGTDHTEYLCTTKEAQNIIPDLSFFYDEPFGDSSAIPTILVSQLAKKKVSVVLSADAGDEVFCGYNSYFKLYENLKVLNKIPTSIKPNLGSIGYNSVRLLPFFEVAKKHKASSFFKSLHKDSLVQARDLFHLMNEKPTSYINKILKNINSYPSPFIIETTGFKNELEVAMAIDYQNYMQNDILTKVDRATMSVSLEGREPFLDHRIIEFTAQLPIEYKYDGFTGKRILKDIVHDYVPKHMMDRPKTGFSLPINKWLRTDLSYLLDDYLNKEALKWSGLFDEEFVVQEVMKFKQNKQPYSHIIWYILMFQMWYKRWIKGEK